jgi:hypothetical protein
LLVIFCLTFSFGACSSGGKSKSADKTPAPFTISAPTGVDITQVAPGTFIESGPISITGIDAATNVSISGGEYAVDNETSFGTSPRTVKPTTIRVRVRSSTKAGQSATAVLSVGGVTASFTVTTEADTTPPEVAILFPPPASMTEGQTLFLRGTVKDVHGTLSEGAVTVNGVEAELELNATADEGTWSVTVDLALGDNTLTVSAVDDSENPNAEESVSSRRVAAIAGESFPDNQNPFGASINADIGWVDGKPVAYVADDTALKIFKVDLTTGVRTVLAGNEGIAEELVFEEPWGIHLGSNGNLYVSDPTRGAIFEVDPATGGRTVLAESDEESFWSRPTGMLLEIEQNQEKLYVADARGKVFVINLLNHEQAQIVDSRIGLQPGGEQFSAVFDLGYLNAQGSIIAAASGGIFSISSNGEQYPFFNSGIDPISSIAESGQANNLYYVNNAEYRVYILDLQTKQSSALTGDSVNGLENQPVDLWGISAGLNLGYLLLVDRQNGLIAMDHVSRKRVIISKSIPLVE